MEFKDSSGYVDLSGKLVIAYQEGITAGDVSAIVVSFIPNTKESKMIVLKSLDSETSEFYFGKDIYNKKKEAEEYESL